MIVFVSQTFSTFFMNNRLAVLDNVHFQIEKRAEDDFRILIVGEEGRCVKRFPKIQTFTCLNAALYYVMSTINIFNDQAELHREQLLAA